MVILLLFASPIASATSGMAWAGAVQSEYGHGSAVAFSPNGDIVASAHESTIMITDTNTREIHQSFFVDFFVESIAFSSDAKYLLIGMVSSLPNTPATVVFEFIDGEYVRAKHTEDGKNINRISISPDDDTFATGIEDGSFVEWKIDTGSGSNLDVDRQYPGSHTGQITCLDHSMDGVHLLSGATDGVIILWNRDSQSEVTRWETNDPIADCKFSHNGDIMTWISGGSLYLRNHDATQSYHGQYDISMNASELSFTSDDSEVAIMVPIIENEQSRRIDFVNIDTTPISMSRTLYIAHNALMFSLHPSDESVAIATLSELLVFYSKSLPTETEIPTEIDTDQDNIPDNVDTDDDGDGILDQFDNICVAGNNCHLQPNQQTIRHFDISINGDEIIVIESIHLDAIHSAHIRQLVATSISSNHRVDTEEYNQFEFAICNEYNVQEIETRWETHLKIDDYAFNSVTVQCRIDSGLYGTNDNDVGTRIKISWEITGRITTSVSAPYNVSIISGIQTPSSSIAQNVHSFPIHVDIEDVSGSESEYEVWNRRDADLFVLVQSPHDTDGAISSAANILTTYWYAWAVVAIGSVILISVIVIRRRNSINFDDYEDSIEEFDADDEWEEIVDEAAEWDQEIEDETHQYRQPKPPSAVTRDIRGMPKPPGAVQRDLARQKRVGHKPKMRKVKRTTTSSSSPEEESEDIVEFTHLLSSNEPQDEVDTSDDSEITDAIAHITSEQDAKVKRKRPVRRKKRKD